MSKSINRQILLASRPKGMPEASNFALKESVLSKPKVGEVLIKTLYLSVDPYMRGRMNDRPSYISPFQLNQPITGGVVGKVVESNDEKFKTESYVYGFLDWADYSIAKGQDLQQLDSSIAPLTTTLGVLGMPGMTAYFGLLDIGLPKKGETIVISGAAGAVGSLVGQIAKIKGCRVVGIAGSDDKVNYLTKDLGFDLAVNYKQTDYFEKLKKGCPNGVDIYFDNVGGEITDHVITLINKNSRVIICGQISMYNLEKPDIGPRNFWIFLTRSATLKGFLVFDYQARFPEGIRQMAQWIKEGRIKYRETIVEGLENAPKAFIGLFKGENVGKQLVKVAEE